MEKNTQNKRSLYIDVLKCFACFLVIYNHTMEKGFYLYGCDDINSFEFVYDYLIAMFSKIAVPIFFMISGTTLFVKNESIKATLKRIPRIFIALLIFYFIYYYVDIARSQGVFTMANFIQEFFNKRWWHLWYLNAYVALLISLPVFRKFAKSIDKTTAIYFMAIGFFWMCIVPIFSFLFVGTGAFNCPWLTCLMLLYPFMGYILAHVFDTKKLNISHIKTLWGANFIFYILGLALEYKYLYTPPLGACRLAEFRSFRFNILHN